MTEKQIKIPSQEHPIKIEPTTDRVIVTAAGKTIADSRRTLTLREAAYPPVFYIPREDVEIAALQRSEHTTYCPYKGDCNYFSITGSGAQGENAVWTYETPYEAAAEIKGYLAFYKNRVDSIDVQSA